MSELFSDITIRNTKFKNRIVMPPMGCHSFTADDGFVSIANSERYRDRARGGVGLIIMEASCVNPTGRVTPTQLGLWSDDQMRGYSRVAEYCHDYEGRGMVQLHHAGIAVAAGVTDDPVAPSDFQGLSKTGQNIQARALTVTEINALQDDFAAAAVRAQKAGLDGVELHGAHGQLISQFFSPLVNKREDEYGGSLVNRTRFATEIIAKIRQATGSNFIISCRMGCDEPDLESSIRIAQELEKAGVDLLHISTGMNGLFTAYASRPTVNPPVPAYFHYNWIVYWGTLIKEKVKVPVIIGDAIKTPVDATWLIENKLAEFVAVGRSLLVDPEWANKGQQYLQVTPCLRCKICAYRTPPKACPQAPITAKKKKHYY
jgi:2,4-dienoyl-CoA reductase-like NADH-dependent reductase (Old Yellow Enzyme family)